MSLWNSPIDAITFQSVVAFCAEQRKEGPRLEYKEEWSSNTPGKQIAKEICAFANTRGGLLILGVDEKGDRTPNPTPAGQILGHDPRQQIIDVCVDGIDPPVQPEVTEFLTNPSDPERGFVVARIEPSLDIPHAINEGRYIYVRVSDQSEPIKATVDQIDRMLEQRRTGVRRQKARADSNIERLAKAMNAGSETGLFAIAIGPAFVRAPLVDYRSCPDYLPSEWGDHFVYSFSDGAYCDYPHDETATLIDVFGHYVLAENMEHSLESHPVDAPSLEECGYAGLTVRAQGGTLKFISLHASVHPLILALRGASKFFDDIGYGGRSRVRMVVRGVEKLPIAVPMHRGREIRGRELIYNRTDDQIDFTIDAALGLDGLILKVADRLLWSWGCRDRDLPIRAVRDAERSIG